MNLHQLRRTGLDLWLTGARLPLTAVEAVLKRGADTADWPPSIAFEKVEATAKDLVGRITRDEELVAIARLQRTEVAKRLEAHAKRSQAHAMRADARRDAETARSALDERRAEAEERAVAREERLAEERAAAERQVREKAARKKAAARKTAAARTTAADRKATQAEARRLREEATALRVEEAAVEARGDVLELDEAVRAKRAARRTG